MSEPSSQPPTIGAFYQCYRQPKALFGAISSFRKYYPASDIYMICDGGDDHSAVAKRFGCTYIHETAHLGNETSTVFETPDKMIVYLKRLREAAGHIKEDYVLLMEDDVLTMGTVSERLRYTVNGVNKGVHFGMKMTAFLKGRTRSIPFWTLRYFWGAFGGCLIDRKFIVEHFNDIDADIAELRKHMRKELPYSTDIWITLLTLYHGGSIGQYKGLCETWWQDYQERLKRGDVAFLHKYKDLYE